MNVFWPTTLPAFIVSRTSKIRFTEWIEKEETRKFLLLLEYLWYSTPKYYELLCDYMAGCALSTAPNMIRKRSLTYIPCKSSFFFPPPRTRCASLRISSFYFILIKGDLTEYLFVNADDTNVWAGPLISRCKRRSMSKPGIAPKAVTVMNISSK